MRTDLSLLDRIGHLRPSEIVQAASLISKGGVSIKEISARLAEIVEGAVGDPPSVHEIEDLVVMAADARAVAAKASFSLDELKSSQPAGDKWGLFCDALAGRSMYDIVNSHLPSNSESRIPEFYAQQPVERASVGAPRSRIAANLTGQVSGAIRDGAREMKEQASNVAESAEGLASQAGEKLLSSVEEQKAAAADFVGGIAGAMRRAANEFDKDVPQAAQYIRRAADQIGTVSDAFRRRDLNQLVADVQGFARKQPTAFLGAAVLAGFAVVRFLKTSTAGATAAGDTRATSHSPERSIAAKMSTADSTVVHSVARSPQERVYAQGE